MNLSIAIQHHPARAGLLPDLIAGLGGAADVVTDPEPDGFRSPWRTYRLALECTPELATHRLIVQDDVQTCPNFLTIAEAAVRACPDRIVTFWHGGQPRENMLAIRHAAALGLPWAPLNARRWCPVVALCWPAVHIPALLAFVDAQNWPALFRADDEIAGRYIRHAGVTAYATVPSLVEHPDMLPSLISRRDRQGSDPARVAACYIADCDGRTIDWTLGS